jgi:RPA family protein
MINKRKSIDEEMRSAYSMRTLCEVLREINDLHQEQTTHDKIIRVKLCEAEDMAKRMSIALLGYHKKIFSGWWNRNPNWEKKLTLRHNTKYCVG